VPANELSRRLHVIDETSGMRFLIDTGADVSLVPKPANHRCEAQALKLFAANDTRIATYGSLRRVLKIGLRRPIEWEFVIADVPYAIIGADLLFYYNLSVDLRRQMLIDNSTSLSIKVGISEVAAASVSLVDPNVNTLTF